MIKRNYGVNIVYFGNVFMLLRSFVLGWNFLKIRQELEKTQFKLMMLPVRGISEINYKQLPEDMVVTYEDAWGYARFWPALKRFLKTLPNLGSLLAQGSKTSKNGGGFSNLDKFAGERPGQGTIQGAGEQGTLIDWLLFGKPNTAFQGVRKIERLYPKAIKSSHSLLGDPGHQVREIHPEMRMEYLEIKNLLKQGKRVNCFPGIQEELDLILHSRDFLDYLRVTKLSLCLDTFHTFQRGSRDGRYPKPVVPENMNYLFLSAMEDKVSEVHFRLDKEDVNLILQGRARKIKGYFVMFHIYLNYKCDIIYELYPDLFSTIPGSVRKLEKVHEMLLQAFHESCNSPNFG